MHLGETRICKSPSPGTPEIVTVPTTAEFVYSQANTRVGQISDPRPAPDSRPLQNLYVASAPQSRAVSASLSARLNLDKESESANSNDQKRRIQIRLATKNRAIRPHRRTTEAQSPHISRRNPHLVSRCRVSRVACRVSRVACRASRVACRVYAAPYCRSIQWR